MRLTFSACILLLAAAGVFARTSQVERNFEASKAKYSVERFGEGEDASSGYDYLYYKDGSRIVKIRVIWSASYTQELRIEDYFFDRDLLLFRKLTARKRQLGALKRGRTVSLTSKEELHFNDRKLTTWIVSGASVLTSDPRWIEREKEALEQAKAEYENYARLSKAR